MFHIFKLAKNTYVTNFEVKNYSYFKEECIYFSTVLPPSAI